MTDLGAADVAVLSYPGASPVATITSASGFTDPSSAVDEHNLVVDSQGP
ncbi:MAG: hypothetical protein WB615_04400 [Candidatus Tumulicola sp.]